MSDDLHRCSNRQCGVPVEDLIDLVREELSPRRREEVSRRAKGCGECLAELESVRSVSALTSSMMRSAEIAPSPGFREKLMARVREAARAGRASFAKASEPAVRSFSEGGRTSPVRGLRVVGPATRRLERIVEREKSVTAWFRPRWKLAVLASSAAAVLAAVMISKAWVFRSPVAPDDEMMRAERFDPRRAVVARFKERKESARSAARRREATLDGSWLDLTGIVDVAGDEEVVLTATIDLSQQENCLLAFRAADWEVFADRCRRAPEGPELERYRAIAGSRHVAPVRDGRIEIPEGLLVKHIRGPEVVVLRLEGRAEIWSRDNLKAYMRHGVPRVIGVDLEG